VIAADRPLRAPSRLEPEFAANLECMPCPASESIGGGSDRYVLVEEQVKGFIAMRCESWNRRMTVGHFYVDLRIAC
jgi:hypothetical protein